MVVMEFVCRLSRQPANEVGTLSRLGVCLVRLKGGAENPSWPCMWLQQFDRSCPWTALGTTIISAVEHCKPHVCHSFRPVIRHTSRSLQVSSAFSCITISACGVDRVQNFHLPDKKGTPRSETCVKLSVLEGIGQHKSCTMDLVNQ